MSVGSCGGVGRALHWVTLFISGDDWSVKWTLDVYVLEKTRKSDHHHPEKILQPHNIICTLYSSIAVDLHCLDVVSGPQTQMHARKLGT